jgi:hypothetical protein
MMTRSIFILCFMPVGNANAQDTPAAVTKPQIAIYQNAVELAANAKGALATIL